MRQVAARPGPPIDAPVPSASPVSPIRPGETTSTSGPSQGPTEAGEFVAAAQNLLLRSGFDLRRYGADGVLGPETAAALSRFQRGQGLPETGRFDPTTILALEAAAAAPPSPLYKALFADGILRAVMAIGYDEGGSHLAEFERVLLGLAKRGYAEVTDEQRQLLGLDKAGRYLTRTLQQGEREVRVVLELIAPDAATPKERFARAMRQTELVMYGGHGRYGSGPDFDDIHSASGNFVIGHPFEAGHVTLGSNDLEAEPLMSAYQLMFFEGCNTFRYFDDLRARAPGKSTKNLDIIGSTTELYWNVTAANLLAMLDGVSDQKDLGQMRDSLDALNRTDSADIRSYFRGDGFEDN